MTPPRTPRVTELAHDMVRAVVRPGDAVIDATVGNGHDTLFLADLVGGGGRVIGFDIQADALESARRLLGPERLSSVALHEAGHETMGAVVEVPVRAVMFNLGYLPGGDKSRITRPDTTVAALSCAAVLLEPGGVITVILYTGHPGAGEEGAAIDAWRESDAARELSAAEHRVSPAAHAPWLLVMKKESALEGNTPLFP